METGVSLGSNLGDRLAHLRRGAAGLAALPGARLLARSRVYETDPMDVPAAYRALPFLNAVVVLDWAGSAHDLLRAAKALEAAEGRRRGERNGPRPLDLDLIYADGLRMDEDGLTLPHPRTLERRFVLEPLADVRPELVLPGAGKTVCQALAALPPGGARLFAAVWVSNEKAGAA